MLIKIIELLKKLLTEFLSQKEEVFKEKPTALHTWVHPLKDPNAVITSPFGPRVHPVTKEVGKMHNGVDYATVIGLPIYSVVTPYKVEKGNQPEGAGLYLKLWYKDSFDNEYWIYYMHLSEAFDLEALPERGQCIGRTGNSGSSTGPHLHFEVRVKFKGKENYQPYEPLQFLK